MSNTNTKRVLVVDDDRHVLDAIRAALESQGYEVLSAQDGQEGLMRAERDAPDLIMLDVMMPRRSGLAVLEKLRSVKNAGPPIIVMTANDEQRHEAYATSQGANFFLKKPFDMQHMLQAVERLLKT